MTVHVCSIFSRVSCVCTELLVSYTHCPSSPTMHSQAGALWLLVSLRLLPDWPTYPNPQFQHHYRTARWRSTRRLLTARCNADPNFAFFRAAQKRLDISARSSTFPHSDICSALRIPSPEFHRPVVWKRAWKSDEKAEFNYEQRVYRGKEWSRVRRDGESHSIMFFPMCAQMEMLRTPLDLAVLMSL